MIALVDLRISNVGSIRHALARVGCPDTVEATAASVPRASALIIPGVGSFGDGMASLREQGLVEPIRRAAQEGMPLFGICLGMQLLAFESDEHGRHEGLGLLEGRVVTLAPTDPRFRVPNIGWCDVRSIRSGVLFGDQPGGCFYHVHSYHLVPKDRRVIAAAIDYSGQEIVVAVEQENIFGVQFHPEKSQDDGLDFLARFVRHAAAPVHSR
ncbi:MAG TPA: imidazole glycerol phosphate synthase subunit HisH [Nitrospiraceae bacterium]|nr:imidazole glycerol phosphate synthase subunit HisH [Nitrospiraceae bacterium]